MDTQTEGEQEKQKPVDLRISPEEVSGEYGKFEVTDEEEKLLILRGLMKNGARVTAYLDDSDDFILTSLLKVDAGSSSLMLALDSNKQLNRRAQLSAKLVCIASQGKIKIQFVLEGVNIAKLEDINAFRGEIPASLIRLQRRDFFRLTIPKGKPLYCNIPVVQEKGKKVEYTANIVNISGRGLTLVVPEELEFSVNQEFPNCRIDLADDGSVVTTLQVRSLYDMTLAGGRIVKRSGCQFVNLPNPVQHQILRFILKIESERLAGK